jgi:hypothetical protein
MHNYPTAIAKVCRAERAPSKRWLLLPNQNQNLRKGTDYLSKLPFEKQVRQLGDSSTELAAAQHLAPLIVSSGAPAWSKSALEED